jgi:hypothetical protein
MIDRAEVIKAQRQRTEGVPPAAMPRIWPSGWKLLQRSADGYAAQHVRQTLIVSDAREGDGKVWRHLSLCGHGRLPTWGELVEAKELFCGTDAKAVQIIPPRSQYVNINPDTLHLFVCLDADPLPDFTSGTGSL